MLTNPILTQLYCEAVLRETWDELKARRLSVEEFEGVRLDCRIGKVTGAAGVGCLANGPPWGSERSE